MSSFSSAFLCAGGLEHFPLSFIFHINRVRERILGPVWPPLNSFVGPKNPLPYSISVQYERHWKGYPHALQYIYIHKHVIVFFGDLNFIMLYNVHKYKMAPFCVCYTCLTSLLTVLYVKMESLLLYYSDRHNLYAENPIILRTLQQLLCLNLQTVNKYYWCIRPHFP